MVPSFRCHPESSSRVLLKRRIGNRRVLPWAESERSLRRPDDNALIRALRSGRIAAAGLDGYEGEPHINPEYRTLPNVSLLPHLGTATIEMRIRIGMRALDNLDVALAGKTPEDLLTPADGTSH